MLFQLLLKKLASLSQKKAIEESLALHRRGEVRSDGLILIDASHQLTIKWRARGIHPWEADRSPVDADRQFNEQCYADADAVICRLFDELPWVDVIRFQVLNSESDDPLLGGTVTRSANKVGVTNASARTRLWRKGVRV